VYYRNHVVGNYKADLIVENTVILELKATEYLVEADELQLINYLKATNIEIGLLINFGKKPEIRRKIFTNDRKSHQHADNADETDKKKSVKISSNLCHLCAKK
jgi:hypothetical protein